MDADCYTRLHRVALILRGEGLIWSFHSFENYPIGIVPHTTLPMDLSIAGLALFLKPWIAASLDWAGILISPFFYLLLVFSMLFVFYHRLKGQVEWRVLGAGFAAMPGLIWATPFGRPDHQSLLLFLIAIALFGEFLRWTEESKQKSFFFGLIWGLAAWTSFYEPLIILLLLVLFNAIIRKKEQKFLLFGFLIVVLLSQVVDGFRFGSQSYLNDTHLSAWFQSIGETRSVHLQEFFLIFTVLVLVWPVLFLIYRKSIPDLKTATVIALLTLSLVVLTVIQKRWLYFSALPLIFIYSILWNRMDRKMQWALAIALTISLGISSAFLKGSSVASVPFALESRTLSRSIHAPGSIVAPWWISPSLLYHSGQPIVASSSHQSIEGIVEVSKFFVGHDWIQAEEFLKRRGVRWIVAYRDDFVLENAMEVLGQKEIKYPKATWAYRLWQSERLPTCLKLRAGTPQFRLYEYCFSAD